MKTAAVEERERFAPVGGGADEVALGPNTERLLTAAPQVIDNVLGSMLGLELHPPSNETPAPTKHAITASSRLRGAWEGVISIHCENGLAAEIASKFFGAETEELVAENIADALTEVASIVVGNLKGVLANQCSHTIPALRDGTDPASTSESGLGVRRITFPTVEGALTLTLIPTSGSAHPQISRDSFTRKAPSSPQQKPSSDEKWGLPPMRSHRHP